MEQRGRSGEGRFLRVAGSFQRSHFGPAHAGRGARSIVAFGRNARRKAGNVENSRAKCLSAIPGESELSKPSEKAPRLARGRTFFGVVVGPECRCRAWALRAFTGNDLGFDGLQSLALPQSRESGG